MRAKIDFDAINNLTEHKLNSKSVNVPLLLSYTGIGWKIGQLAIYLFARILNTKLYGEYSKSKMNEDKRIYSDSEITLENILMDINPGKYGPQFSSNNDQANLSKRIKELDSLNIFYYWKYKDYYLFIMERNVAYWKCYNSKGCMGIKTIKKIVALAPDMICCMLGIIKRNNVFSSEDHVFCSFEGFLSRMLHKLNPVVLSVIPTKKNNESLFDYLKKLNGVLETISDEAGYVCDCDFEDAIPYIVKKRLKLCKKEKKNKEQGMNVSFEQSNEKTKSMENDLVPKNQNIVKTRRGRPKGSRNLRTKKTTTSSPKLMRYKGDINPFDNARELMKYYRSFVELKMGRKINFNSFEADGNYAAQILDILIGNKKDTKTDLNGWLSNFCEYKLKGDKCLNMKYTSMKALKDSFIEFHNNFPLIDA